MAERDKRRIYQGFGSDLGPAGDGSHNEIVKDDGRDVFFRIALTQAEAVPMVRAAKSRGMRTAQWIRAAALEKIERDKGP